MTQKAPRYADGPVVEVDVLIAAPPSTVWRFVSDIGLPARFSSEFTGAEWAEPDAAPGVGSRFTGHSEHAAIGTWQTTCTLVEYEEPKAFAYVVAGLDGPEPPSCTWRFTLEPEAGGTRLRQWARMGPGRSGLSFAIEAMPDKEQRIVARRLREFRENMTATVNGIRDLAEEAAR
ncbi:SRPBCC family protein [Spirillospora sp. NPDC047279]|uniref:SRPBCC family protein n=1 Tax=Spirillospora sp. NPDC047279 TaxID=3155478 RepID=UPI0033DA4CEE